MSSQKTTAPLQCKEERVPTAQANCQQKPCILSSSINNISASRLVKLWAERYVPDLSPLSKQGNSLAEAQLAEFTSPAGRAATVAKLSRLQLDCEFAEIKTNTLFSYIPNVVNLSESRRIAQFALRVYQQALLIYQQQSPLPVLDTTPVAVPASFEQWTGVLAEWSLPAMEQLAIELEPLLQELRQQHLSTGDRRTLGFVTTQFHFSSQLILRRLTLPEQLLLSPYFRFIEERVSIPLQQVCEAATQHEPDSPTLAVVQQLLPQSQEIAQAVYRQATQLYPTERSRRGGLKNAGITASTIRDLQMFQCYLWVAVLERRMTAVEQQLLPLCIMVFPSIDVSWELVQQMLQLLVDEVMERVEAEQRDLLLPYTQKMQQLFSAF